MVREMLCYFGTYVLLLSIQAAYGSRYMRLDRLNYEEFPTRDPETAAIIEWGNSAIISALDATVAQFGPQADLGAFFEVEGLPVLSDPIDGNVIGVRSRTMGRSLDTEALKNSVLRNVDEMEGNIAIMTNSAGLFGVEMAMVAKNSGAAALIVVNTDHDNPDFIYSMSATNESDENNDEIKLYAESIDIPIVMISLSSGNVLTSATSEFDENGVPIDNNINYGMPETIRLYAGAGRPFFEDISSEYPILYLIHHLLEEEECDSIIASAEHKVEPYNGEENLLEGTEQLPANTIHGIERTFLWKGMLKGSEGKGIDERMEQVTGFPKEHFSDFQIDKYSAGSHHRPRVDQVPIDYGNQMVSLYIFLNDDYEGGEVVFHTANPPIKLRPRKGMAIVFHNSDQNAEFDISTMHADLAVSKGTKWMAKKWVYADPITPARRIALPIFALPFGGKLPTMLLTFHNFLLEKFGSAQGGIFFNKLVVLLPLLFIISIVSIIDSISRRKNNPKESKENKQTRRRKKRD